MKKFVFVLSLFCSYSGMIAAQQRVIADLDIDSDADDVSALAMLNTMHNRGEIRLLGVVVTSDDSSAASCASAINTYFGNRKIPIGILKNQPALRNHSRYTKKISEEFPGERVKAGQLPDAWKLYRKLLAGSPDSSVTIVTIGHLSNFQNLLMSGPDRFSKMNGKELADKKVMKWLCMGGQFPEGKEANFYRPDPGSTVYCLNEWKRPVIFAGWEVGEKIKTGGDYLKGKVPVASPVYRSYELYNNFKGRASWDQVAVLLLTDAADKYFEKVSNGICQVSEDGSNKWITGKTSNHTYVKLKPGADLNEIARMIDNMVIKDH